MTEAVFIGGPWDRTRRDINSPQMSINCPVRHDNSMHIVEYKAVRLFDRNKDDGDTLESLVYTHGVNQPLRHLLDAYVKSNTSEADWEEIMKNSTGIHLLYCHSTFTYRVVDASSIVFCETKSQTVAVNAYRYACPYGS
jgi:hypothetical protein